MRPFAVNLIIRREFSMDVGKIAQDVLIADRGTPTEKNNNRVSRSKRNDMRDSITDKWLKKALTSKPKAYTQKEVKIYSPIILKTLQKLRSTDNVAAYFTLLNKIKASDITWISRNRKQTTNRKEIPIEFYHEVSNMIHRMSLNCSDFGDLRALTNFSIRLLNEYKLTGSISHSKIPYETKFYKNCLLVIVQSESIIALLDAFKEIPPHQNGLKNLTELVFYYQTGQFIKVLEHLEKIVSTTSSKLSITKEQITAFSTPLLNILRACLLNGEEQICNTLLQKLKRERNYEMDEHSFAVLKELSERLGKDQVLMTLVGDKQEFKTKIVSKNMTWSNYINSLHQNQINLFQEELPFDYSQIILSSVGSSLQDWETFIDLNPLPDDANDSLKSFYLNSILTDLSTRKNIGFMISALEYLVYKKKLCQHLIYSHKLAGSTESSGFHTLIKSISNSTSSKITAYTLHDFLQKHSSKFGFQFNTNDYYHFMKACTYKTDRQTTYYFLYYYLKNQGHTLYTGPKPVDWQFPSNIFKVLNQVNNSQINNRIKKIEKNARDLFIEKSVSDSQVKDDDLRRLFGQNYSPQITVKKLLSIDAVGDQLENLVQNQSVYYLSIDLEYSQRLSNCLDYIMKHSSPFTT